MKTPANKILIGAVVVLLLVNIALVVFMIKEKNNHKGRYQGGKGDASEMMARELNMTEEQKKAHKQLKEEHFKNIKPLFDSLRNAKTAFFGLVKADYVTDSLLNSYSQRIVEKQTAIDKLTFAHFKRIRNLFTAEQQTKFDTFVQKMMQRGRRDSAGKGK